MILAGAGRVTMFKDFIDHNPEWSTSEVQEIMEK